MDFKQINPWKWLKGEGGMSGTLIPVYNADRREFFRFYEGPNPELDNLLDSFCGGFGYSPFRTSDVFSGSLADGVLKPNIDLKSDENEYTISFEIPDVDAKDIKLEIFNNLLIISGDKKKDKNYFRMEPFPRSFKRGFSLPEDADRNEITTFFKKGILTINMQKKVLPGTAVHKIQIH